MSSNMRTIKDKENIIKEYYKYGQSYVCRKYNLSRSLIWNWVKKYEEKGIEGLKSSTGKHKNLNAGLHLRKTKDKIEEPIILHTISVLFILLSHTTIFLKNLIFNVQ